MCPSYYYLKKKVKICEELTSKAQEWVCGFMGITLLMIQANGLTDEGLNPRRCLHSEVQTGGAVGEAVPGNMGHQRHQHKIKLNPLHEMLIRLSKKGSWELVNLWKTKEC